MSDRVVVERQGGVAHVQMNRPDKRNGLDLAMFDALVARGAELAGDRTVRAVVLSGAGAAFCAGLDFQSFFASGQEGAARLLARGGDSPANLAQRVAWVWREVPVPVIAAVHGAAFGGGLQIALAADIRLVASDARLCVMEIHYGLVPDMSISQTLPRLVPLDVAKELTFTGREVSGEEAVRLGLCTRLSADPVPDALELARAIASRSPQAIRAAKRLLDEAPGLGVAAGLALETELQLPLLGSPNQLEAVTARMARRAPVFGDAD